jgi:hypothetical protein
LLLLTGLDWAEDYLGQICPSYKCISGKYAKAVGTFSVHSETQTKVVVAVHPQSKKESPWGDEVLNAFE